MKDQSEAPLKGYRILDLTTEVGLLCSKLLGDLGADVIKIEKPGGDDARKQGPFHGNNRHPENSLFWWAFNTNKRGITLDITKPEGQYLFKRLAGASDIMVESYPPGYLDELGLGYEAIRQISPGIIYVSITHYGQTGPDAFAPASDLTLVARCGWMFLCGDPDRPPVRVSLPQAYVNAGAEAAMATSIALMHRQLTGEGQRLDVSVFESLGLATFHSVPFYYLNKTILKRTGAFRGGFSESVNVRQIYGCADGLVVFALIGGVSGARNNKAMTRWLTEEGHPDPCMNDVDWDEFDLAKASAVQVRQIEDHIGRFFSTRTKKHIHEQALARGLMIGIISGVDDVCNSTQLASRMAWDSIKLEPDGQEIRVPDGFVKFSDAACGLWRRWPMIGEHNEEVYEGEVGLSRMDLVRLRDDGII